MFLASKKPLFGKNSGSEFYLGESSLDFLEENVDSCIHKPSHELLEECHLFNFFFPCEGSTAIVNNESLSETHTAFAENLSADVCEVLCTFDCVEVDCV